MAHFDSVPRGLVLEPIAVRDEKYATGQPKNEVIDLKYYPFFEEQPLKFNEA